MDLNAVPEWLTAIATTALVALAWYQIREIRSERLKYQTLTECTKYETDPIINQQTELLYRMSGGGKNYTQEVFKAHEVQHAAINLLNYFSSLAIGVEQGLYHEGIVRAQLESSIVKSVDLLNGKHNELGLSIDPSNFSALVALRSGWRHKPPKL